MFAKGLLTTTGYGLFSSENHVMEKVSSFFLPIFIILSDIEESTIKLSDFHLFRVQRWLNRFVYITNKCSCCPLNCLSVPAKSPICRSPNTLPSCFTSTGPSAATTSMSGSQQAGACPGLPAARPCPTPLSLCSWQPPWTTCHWCLAATPCIAEMSIVSFQIKYSGSCGELCWGWESPCSHGVSGPLRHTWLWCKYFFVWRVVCANYSCICLKYRGILIPYRQILGRFIGIVGKYIHK